MLIRPLPNNVIPLAPAIYAREQRRAYQDACRQIDEAIADIIRIAERAKAAIEDCRPSDSEPQEVPFQ